jgi:hypothetical protein
MNTPSHSKEVVDSTDDNSASAICANVSAATITDKATGDTSLHTMKNLLAPKTPPRQFINKAKKTKVYWSSAAVTFVKGAR